MSEAFDPYHSWLGIPPAEQPADYYRLLGINRFESNEEIIANAAERQIRHVEGFKIGAHAREADKMLRKLSTAKACLLDDEKKCVYDRVMRGATVEPTSPPLASNGPETSSMNDPISRSRPRSRNPLTEVVKVALGGIAGLVIGIAILWYGFGMDVLGVMDSPKDRTPKPLAQNEAKVQSKLPLRDADDLPLAKEAKLPEPDVLPEKATESIITRSAESVASLPMSEETTARDESAAVQLTQELATVDGPPSLAVAPFNAEQARAHQQAWANYLGVPIEFTNAIGMKFVVIPPGEYTMGSPRNEDGHLDSEQAHRVRISRPYYLGLHEVTVGQFHKFINATGYRTEAEISGKGSYWNESTQEIAFGPNNTWKSNGITQTDSHPVVNVTWNDAVAFCKWLGMEYGLPTEAEWEYACRAGTALPYFFGSDVEELTNYANVSDGTAKAKLRKYPNWFYIDNADGYVFTSPVGQFPANAWGLHDMHGNVWEWCHDWYDAHYYAESPAVDPRGPAEGTKRVHRGGGWSAKKSSGCRSAHRVGALPTFSSLSCGFRVLRLSLAFNDHARPDHQGNSASTKVASEDETATPARSPTPPSEAQVAAEAIVRSVFADEYASAKTSAEKRELAEKLLQIGLDTNDDLASRFVTIRSARNVAVEAGTVDLAYRAIDAMTDSFEMDSLAEQTRLAEDLAEVSLNDEETAKLKRRVVELREKAFAQDAYPVAVSLNELSRGLGKATDKQWTEATDHWAERLEAGSTAFDLVQEALNTLASSPGDSEANSTIGRYRCLLKGEWKTGLPYLAKGSDAKLRGIAEREMASSDPTPNEALALADSWWDLATELSEIEKPQVQMRAAQLYRWALPNLSGLSAAKADKRLRDLRAMGIDSATVLLELPHHEPALIDGDSKSEFKVMSNSIGMKLVLIPAGEFKMGSQQSIEFLTETFQKEPKAFTREFPSHVVHIMKSFYLSRTEVTVGQFREFANDTGYVTEAERLPDGPLLWDRNTKQKKRLPGVSWKNPQFPQAVTHPVAYVTWNDAQAFCKWLGQREGVEYRLPTEAEWEYSYRAGSREMYYTGASVDSLKGAANVAGQEHAPFVTDYRDQPLLPWTDKYPYTSPVGTFPPNDFGLYDMIGNVWEWVGDRSFREYKSETATNPIGQGGDEWRLLRGGSFDSGPRPLRASHRAAVAELIHGNTGFRVVRELDITP